jgi:hypothetical protein
MKEKITAFFFAILFFILYVLVATDLHIHTFFTSFFPKLHLLLLPFILIFPAIYLISPGFFKKVCGLIEKYSIFVLPALTFFISLAVNRLFILTEQPEDGIHYVWLAKIIANGRFYFDIPDFYEHYRNSFLFVHSGKYTSIFLPGFSLFMAPFAKLGLEYMFNPLLAGINTFLVGIHAEKLKNRWAGVAAMLLFTFSTAHIMQGAFYFPHHFGLTLVLVSAYFLLYKSLKPLNIFFAGFLIAYSLCIRPQNAVYLYAAFIVYILFKHKSLKTAALFTLPFLFLGGLLCWYNWFFTGDPLVFTQDVLFGFLDPKDFCHRPGLGKGCIFTAAYDSELPFTGTTIPFLAHISFLRLNSFVHRITFHQIMLLFIFPAIISKPYKYFLYYFTPLCALAFYFWFFIAGNFFGQPRYLLESGAMILITASCGFVEIFEYLFNKNSRSAKLTAIGMNGLFAGLIVFFSFFVLPSFCNKSPFGENPYEVKRIIEENKIENSIVFTQFQVSFQPETTFKIQDDPPFDRHGNLIIYSLGRSDENLLKYYSEKDFKGAWRILVSSDIAGKRRYSLTKLDFMEDDGVSYINFMAKDIPISGYPKFIYGILGSGNKFSEDFFKYRPPAPLNFMGTGIFFGEPDGKNYYGHEHTLKEGGTYDVEVTFIPTECTTKFHIDINGIKSASYDNTDEKDLSLPKTIEFSAEMKKGKNSIKFIPEADGCLILSDMVLQKR